MRSLFSMISGLALTCMMNADYFGSTFSYQEQSDNHLEYGIAATHLDRHNNHYSYLARSDRYLAQQLASYSLKKVQDGELYELFCMQCRDWSERDFINYFIDPLCPDYEGEPHALTSDQQQEILSLHHLYQFDGFPSMIKDFSEYSAYIKNLKQKLADSGYAKKIRKLPGFKEKKFDAIINALHQEIMHKEERKTQQQEAARRTTYRQHLYTMHYRPSIRTAVQRLVQQYKQQLDDDMYDDTLHERLHDRIQAIEATYNHDFVVNQVHYSITDQASLLLHKHQYNAEEFQRCLGSPLQLQLHEELVTILNGATAITTALSDNVLDFLEITRDYVHAGYVDKALQWTDFCWALFDYTKAIGEGVCEGIVSTSSMIAHPIETMQGFGTGLVQAGRLLGSLLDQLLDINFALRLNPQAGVDKCDQLINNCKIVYAALEKKLKETPPKDLVRNGTAFITEGFLTGKALGACHKLYCAAQAELTTVLPAIKKLINTPFVSYEDIIDGIPVLVANCEYILAHTLTHHDAPTAGLIAESIDSLVHMQQTSGSALSNIAHTPRYGHSIHDLEKTFTKIMGSEGAHKVIPYDIIEHVQSIGHPVDLIIHPAPNQKWKAITHVLSHPEEIDELVRARKLLPIDATFRTRCPLEAAELTHKACYHIFGIEIGREVKQNGQITEFFSGFHHDANNILQKRGIYALEEFTCLNFEVSKIRIKEISRSMVDIAAIPDKTTFNSSMSRTMIIDIVESALKNLMYQPELKQGRWIFDGKWNNNFIIRIVTENNGKIISFYPIQIP